jgi:hypothetical protein
VNDTFLITITNSKINNKALKININYSLKLNFEVDIVIAFD